MSIDQLKKLREPFAENQISMLPKPMKKREEMDKLPKATCKICGGYHATSMMMHLSYVGHAALTDRLLDTDPMWTWEPLAVDATGYPVIDKDGGMWIKLTVCGVTRLGYGDAQGKQGGDAMKERIGDALRNAAMRFGAALDLWHKGDLHVIEPPDPPPPPPPPAPETINADQNKRLRTMLTSNKIDPAAFKSHFGIESSLDLQAVKMDEAVKWINDTAKGAGDGESK